MLCKIHDGRCWCENMKRIVFQNFICLNCLGSFASSIYLFVYTVVNGRNTKNLQNFICLDSEGCSSYLSCCAICRMDAAGTGIWNVLLVSPSSASQLTAASASPHLPAAPGGTPPTFLPSLDNIDTIDNNNNDKKTTFTPLLVPSCWYHNKQRHVPSTQAPLHSERALATLKQQKQSQQQQLWHYPQLPQTPAWSTSSAELSVHSEWALGIIVKQHKQRQYQQWQQQKQ